MILMKYSNSTEIPRMTTITMKPNDKKLTVKCVVYGAKPAAKIVWEYNGIKLSHKSDPAHCFDSTKHDKECIINQERSSTNEPSLYDTVSIVTVGNEKLNKLKNLCHHPALRSPQRLEIQIKVEQGGKFKMQQILKRYLFTNMVYFFRKN